MPIRQPIVAGRFYPALPAELKEEIDSYKMGEAGEKIEPLMLVLPHAGYMFCGRIIAKTLGRVTLPDTLIMLGPNHTGRGTALSVWPEGEWLTPFGKAEVDRELAGEIISSNNGFQPDTTAHAFEHSLEVLLPFLQDINPAVRMVPVAVATGDPAALKRAASALAGIIAAHRARGRNITLLVSSDMNHFDNQDVTVRKDGLALECLAALNPDGLLQTVKENNISMCGVWPASLALYAALELGAQKAEIAAYGTSAAASGDSSRVVGYAGAVIY